MTHKRRQQASRCMIPENYFPFGLIQNRQLNHRTTLNLEISPVGMINPAMAFQTPVKMELWGPLRLSTIPISAASLCLGTDLLRWDSCSNTNPSFVRARISAKPKLSCKSVIVCEGPYKGTKQWSARNTPSIAGDSVIPAVGFFSPDWRKS